MTIIEVKG